MINRSIITPIDSSFTNDANCSIIYTLSSNSSMKRFSPLINIATFSCVRTTPFGSPLVPLVYITVQMLIGCGGTNSVGFSLPYTNKIRMRCSTKNAFCLNRHMSYHMTELMPWVRVYPCITSLLFVILGKWSEANDSCNVINRAS